MPLCEVKDELLGRDDTELKEFSFVSSFCPCGGGAGRLALESGESEASKSPKLISDFALAMLLDDRGKVSSAGGVMGGGGSGGGTEFGAEFDDSSEFLLAQAAGGELCRKIATTAVLPAKQQIQQL